MGKFIKGFSSYTKVWNSTIYLSNKREVQVRNQNDKELNKLIQI